MITKFKIFESNSETPKVGDYVICNVEQSVDERGLEDLQDFLDSNIGVIVEIQEGRKWIYKVQFDNIPADIADDFCTEEEENIILFNSDEILYHNINKEDCELYFAAKKYNI